MEDTLSKMRRSNPKLVIEAPQNAPYKCVGGLIFYAQKVGFTDIDTRRTGMRQ